MCQCIQNGIKCKGWQHNCNTIALKVIVVLTLIKEYLHGKISKTLTASLNECVKIVCCLGTVTEEYSLLDKKE
jgi:hypothetical protein